MKIKSILILAVIATMFSSCGSDYPGYSKTKTGLYYKVITDAKDTLRPEVDDVVTVSMKFYDYERDSILYDSEKFAQQGPLRIIVSPQFDGDIFEGLLMMGKGDSMSFLVRADSLLEKGIIPHPLDSMNMIRFEVKLIDVQRNADFKVEQEMEQMRMQRELEELESMESEDIKSYIGKNPGFSGPHGNGYYFKVLKQGSGVVAAADMHSVLDFECTLINGVPVASTKLENQPMDYIIGSQDFFVSWDDALIGRVKKGSEIQYLFPSSMAFGKNGGGRGLVPPYAPLLVTVTVNELMSAADMAARQNREDAKNWVIEKAEIEKYLKANNITAKPTASGLYYVPKVEGKGAQAIPGKTVKVHYTGKLLTGVVFDSSYDRNMPFEFVLGRGNVIEGWDEGIAMMKQGGEATFIIPSKLGYGSKGAGKDIKPYSPLVFDVKLIEVK